MLERPTKHDNYKTLSCTLVINDYKITLTRVRLDLTKHNRHNALASVPDLLFLTGGRKDTLTRHVETTKEIQHSLTTLQQRKYHIPLQRVNYIPREPTYSLGSWGAQAHLYCLGYLLHKQKRSKPSLLFGQPLPVIRHYFWRIHDVLFRLPTVMLDTITLPRNLVIGFGVPNAPKSMIYYRLHLILES